jgi:multiple sugar transport system substrate-binding protein
MFPPSLHTVFGAFAPNTYKFLLVSFGLTLVLMATALFQMARSDYQTPKKFDDAEIVVAVQAASAIGNPAKAHGKTWEQRTGGKVTVVQFPFDQLFDEYMSALTSETPVFDVILYAPAWAGDFFPYLAELPTELTDEEAFDDIHPAFRDRLMVWDGKWIAVTIDGDSYNGYYRKDLFEVPNHRVQFEARYGYELSVPDTWQQYHDIAEFFTGREGPDGEQMFGVAEPFARGTQQFWNVFSRAAAYTNHPDYPGSQFFDPETMHAQIGNPGWIRAVEEYLEVLHFSPPEAKKFGIVEARQQFIAGRVAMILDWGDTGILAADAKRSSIAGNVGYFTLPGTYQIWNYKKGVWDTVKTPYKVPFLAFGGWVGSVPSNSRNAKAAWDYLMWYSSPENSLRDVMTSGSGINPYRFSHFTNLDAWTRTLSKRAASEYLGVLRTSLDSPFVALDLRLPGFHYYTEALETNLDKALNQELTVKQAMTQAAGEWEKITDHYGREKQRVIYRAAMGLSPANKD